MDKTEAGPLHQGDACKERAQQAHSRSLHERLDEEVPVGEGKVIAIEELVREALVEQVAWQIDGEEVDHEETLHHLFVQVESPLVLKDERSS